MGEGEFVTLPNRVLHPRPDHIVSGRIDLKHSPHGVHVLGRIAPIASCLDISQLQFVLEAQLDSRDALCDFPSHEFSTPARRLVVEEDS